MKKDKVKKILGQKRIRDYTYAILFLLISSFFAIFVIRPVLSVAFALQREAKDLEQINETFEKNIQSVVKLQSELESVRADKHVVEEALPDSPQLRSVIEDLRRVETETGVVYISINVNDITLKSSQSQPEPGLQTLQVELVMQSDFGQAIRLIDNLTNQRRLKSISKLNIVRDTRIGESAQVLKLTMSIDGYYL